MSNARLITNLLTQDKLHFHMHFVHLHFANMYCNWLGG
jgi:hypothetical protein